jgi:hypothetical protein
MNSFISHFKPWLLVLFCLAVFETSYDLVFNPPRVTWNSFLNFKFTEHETFQRLVTHDKVIASEGFHADIIQVGDSSGLHGVIPPVVMSSLPGYTYLNMSVATNLGYSGYLNLARVQLKRNPSARYLVLYASPIGGVPRKSLWDDDQKLMAPQIYNEFLSPLHHLFQLPSLSVRQEVIGNAYYLGYRFQQKDAVLSTNRGYLAFTKSFRETNGWVRETDVEGDIPSDIYKNLWPDLNLNNSAAVREAVKGAKVTEQHFFDWSTLQRRSYFDVVYGAFANLAKARDVKLILVFNPLPESLRRPEFEEFMDWKAIDAALARFRKAHPEVIVTNFEFWPDEDFSVFSHISTPASIKSSRRVGELLARYIEPRTDMSSNSQQRWLAEPLEGLNIDFRSHFAGYGWTDAAGTTNGFPMQHIGPRGKAWLFAHVKPGSDYVLKISYKGIAEEVEGIRLFVNGANALRKTRERNENEGWIEYALPAAEVGKYSGWLNLEFDTGHAGQVSTFSFRELEIKSK